MSGAAEQPVAADKGRLELGHTLVSADSPRSKASACGALLKVGPLQLNRSVGRALRWEGELTQRAQVFRRTLLGTLPVVLTGVAWLLTQRVTLAILLVGAPAILGWTAARKPDRLWKRACATTVIAILLAAIPVDVWVIRTGEVGVGFSPVVWGLWLSPVPRKALAAGCVVPLVNPTQYAFWLSY